MARHTKDYDEGYQAAIEAIKQALSGQNNQGGEGDGPSLPNDMTSPQEATGQGSQSSGGQKSDKQQSRSGSGKPAGPSVEPSKDNHGTVSPEDCVGPNSLGNTPNTPGGIIDRQTGDDICKKEGYDSQSASQDVIDKEWGDLAIKESSKIKGNGAGDFKAKLVGIYKTTTDWKTALRKVVGKSLSPIDKRQAYANKNILVSQDRIARTDKDEYNNMDYMMAWIDSSGSMSDHQLKLCLSEVYSVALAKKPIKLVIIQCDTKIQDIKVYTSLSQLKKDIVHATVKGRGGTELKPCWDLLEKDPKYKRRPAELVMIFTDGYLDQYKRNPKTMKNLCWVILDNLGWEVRYKDNKTMTLHLRSDDIK